MILNFVVGTAAELIKVYPIIRLAKEQGHQVRILSTGQGRENFLMQYRDFHLPESDLHYLLASEGDLDRLSKAIRWFMRALCIPRLALRDRFLIHPEIPSYAVVHGDTMSTLMGAWIARRAGLQVIHVEAGLRSNRLFHPFPEEITRRLVSRLARWHMAPDQTAVENLQRSKVKGTIVNTEGNTLMDAVRMLTMKSTRPSEPFVLVNVHRFENLNSATRWKTIVDTVMVAARTRKVIFVMHPQTEYKLSQDTETREAFKNAKVELTPRKSFSEFLRLLDAADYLISDGGSNQEECSYIGKPCLLMRESTERREGLETCCVLSQFDEDKINRFLENYEELRGQSRPYEARSPSQILLNSLSRDG